MLAFILSVILSLEADFVQTKTLSMMSEPQVSVGHMSYRSPDYLRWSYTSPQTLTWEIDGERSNVNPQVQRLLRMIMGSIANEQEDQRAQKESKKLFQSVTVTMDEKTHVAQRVEMIEKNGDKTVIEFNHVVVK